MTNFFEFFLRGRVPYMTNYFEIFWWYMVLDDKLL